MISFKGIAKYIKTTFFSGNNPFDLLMRLSQNVYFIKEDQTDNSLTENYHYGIPHSTMINNLARFFWAREI